MQNLIVSYLQTRLAWEKPEENRRQIAEQLKAIDTSVDVIVLPEMFTTGFSMNARNMAEPTEGPTLAWMREQAHKFGALITGSFIVDDNERFYNRMVLVKPSGEYHTYDKRHLFRMAGEHKSYSPGERTIIVEWQGWRILPCICFDLRFPAWTRNRLHRPDASYDLMLCIANWPERRRMHWRSLLLARAVENQAYVVGVNRVGTDANKITYSGDSAIADYEGVFLTQMVRGEGVEIYELEADRLNKFREKFPAWMAADEFEITGPLSREEVETRSFVDS
jgi:predicted amidohydrolase